MRLRKRIKLIREITSNNARIQKNNDGIKRDQTTNNKCKVRKENERDVSFDQCHCAHRISDLLVFWAS